MIEGIVIFVFLAVALSIIAIGLFRDSDASKQYERKRDARKQAREVNAWVDDIYKRTGTSRPKYMTQITAEDIELHNALTKNNRDNPHF